MVVEIIAQNPSHIVAASPCIPPTPRRRTVMGRIIPHGELLGFGPILACITVPNNSPWGIIKP